MGLSLTKTTANNVSGSYTPNCLVNGLFVLNITGDVTINAPTNCADGQAFAVIIATDDTHIVTWADAYSHGANGGPWPQGQIDPGAYGCNYFVYYNGACCILNNQGAQMLD